MKVLVFNTSAVSVIHQLLKSRFPSNIGHRNQFPLQNYLKTLAQYLGEMILNVFGSEVYSKVKRLRKYFEKMKKEKVFKGYCLDREIPKNDPKISKF